MFYVCGTLPLGVLNPYLVLPGYLVFVNRKKNSKLDEMKRLVNALENFVFLLQPCNYSYVKKSGLFSRRIEPCKPVNPVIPVE